MREVQLPLVLPIISIAAFCTKLIPLAFSQYPFNNDSLGECGIAADIIRYGSISYSPGSPWEFTHSVDLPAMSVLLAYVSLMLGVTPVECAQYVTAVFSVLTVGAVFLLGRMFTATTTGGTVAAMAALFSGTFVFTTGSTWKLAMGFALFALLYFTFVRRNILQYRLLTLGVLVLLPFVHHLAAAVVMVALAFMLIWSWIVSLSQSKVTRRLVWDTLTVLPPIIVAATYYSVALADRQDVYSSGIRVALFVCNFALLSMMAYLIMAMRTHRRPSFALLVGEGVAAILLFDYLGFLFPYEASASSAYVILILSTAILVTLAWYGTELIVERRRQFMAVQLSLIVAPLSIILFGVETGLPSLSLQVVYRTFDFLQFFIFIGLAFAVVELGRRRPRIHRHAMAAVLVCMICSFPFGFFTQDLLGVRHDSQAYELDAMHWLSNHTDEPNIVSDERLAFMARNTIWIEKRAHLPQDLVRSNVLSSDFFYMVEDSWTTSGVNDFPHGLTIVDARKMSSILSQSNILYVGGPVSDRAILFTCGDYTSSTS